jgi:hypothetical protein
VAERQATPFFIRRRRIKAEQKTRIETEGVISDLRFHLRRTSADFLPPPDNSAREAAIEGRQDTKALRRKVILDYIKAGFGDRIMARGKTEDVPGLHSPVFSS